MSIHYLVMRTTPYCTPRMFVFAGINQRVYFFCLGAFYQRGAEQKKTSKVLIGVLGASP